MDENTIMNPTEIEDDVILPEGWAEGDEFFDESTWTGAKNKSESESAKAEEAAEESEDTADEDKSVSAEATGDESATSNPTGEAQGEAVVTEEAPATEQTGDEAKFRFKTTIDHETVDVELQQSEIEELYQKAHVVDRVRDKLNKLEPTMNRVEEIAKKLGYQSADEWLNADLQARKDSDIDKLVNEGVHPEVAADIVGRKYGAYEVATPAPQEAEQQSTTSGRDYKSEVEELFAKRPELRGTPLPPEVTKACVEGQPLLYAYLAYESKTAINAKKSADATIESLRQQLAIATQNSAAAAKAPVRGTSGGGSTDSEPEDDFLTGFNSDTYY